MKIRPVYIRWYDAMTLRTGWESLDTCLEWGENEDGIVEQLGYVLKETKLYTLIAGSILSYDSENPKYNDVTKIPKTWILEKKFLDKETI